MTTSPIIKKSTVSTQPDWRQAFMPHAQPSPSSTSHTLLPPSKAGLQLDTTTKVKAGHKPTKRNKQRGHVHHVNHAHSNSADRAHSWEYLPLDLALHIVHYLSIHDKLLLVSRLNHFWHHVIYDQPTAWAHDTLALHSRMSDEHILQVPLTSPVHHVRSLEMTNRQCQTDGRYARLLNHVGALAPNLLRLNIIENSQLAPFNMVPISQMKALQHLTITLGHSSADPLVALVQQLPQLRSLHYTSLQTDAERTRLLKALTDLPMLSSLAERQHREQQMQPAWSEQSLSALARIKTLRDLHIRMQNEESLLSQLLSMHHLQTLHLSLFKPLLPFTELSRPNAHDRINHLAQLAFNNSSCFTHLHKLTISHDQRTRPTLCAESSMQLVRAFAACHLEELHWANDRWTDEHLSILCNSQTLQHSLTKLTIPYPEEEQRTAVDPIVLDLSPLLRLSRLNTVGLRSRFDNHHLTVLQQHPALQTVIVDVTSPRGPTSVRMRRKYCDRLSVMLVTHG